MIGEDQMYASFKNSRGTPKYFHNMMLDFLTKIRHFGPPAFFITCSAAEMGSLIEIIQIIARQFGTILTENEIETCIGVIKLCEKKSSHSSSDD